MSHEVDALEEANMDFLRLLSCNGGHKDVKNNIASQFKKHHNIDSVYAMDGNLSFYPSVLNIFETDHSQYLPRLSTLQDGFKKYTKKYIFRILA